MAKFPVITVDRQFFGVAAALDLGFYRAILVHPRFYKLPYLWRRAILAHEEGHLLLKHARARWCWALRGLWWRDPAALRGLMLEQECEADAYCAAKGLEEYLIAFLLRSQRGAVMVDSQTAWRVRRLRGKS